MPSNETFVEKPSGACTTEKKKVPHQQCEGEKDKRPMGHPRPIPEVPGKRGEP